MTAAMASDHSGHRNLSSPFLMLCKARVDLGEDRPLKDINQRLEDVFSHCATIADDKDEATRLAAQKLHGRVDRINRIYSHARERTRVERLELELEIAEFAIATADAVDWYSGDAFRALPERRLGEVVKRHPPKSASMLDRCVRHCFRFYGSQEEIDRIEDGSKPIQILMNLIELLRGFEHLDDAAGYLIPLCSSVIAFMDETEPAVETWKLLAYTQILITLGKVLERHQSRTREGLASDTRSFPHLTEVTRVLKSAYLSSAPDGLCGRPNSKPRQPQCRHTWSLASLQVLQMHAYAEVRAKVMLTIGTILPSELTELMVEAALVAEGMPLDPRVYVTHCGVPTVKKEYSCEAMDRLEQDADRRHDSVN